MTEDRSRYKVKLYGYMGDDPKRFTASMAILLGMDRSSFARLLDDSPTMVPGLFSARQAEHIREWCMEYGGLCLVEELLPESVEDEEPRSGNPIAEILFQFINTLKDAQTELRQKAITAGFVLSVAALVLFIGGAFASSFINTVVPGRAVAKQSRIQDQQLGENKPGSTRVQEDQDLSPAELRIRINELADRVEELRFRLSESRQTFRKLVSTGQLDDYILFERSKETGRLHDEVVETVKEIAKLQEELDLKKQDEGYSPRNASL